MARIVPKLNLNKTPQLVENNSLIMAKNVRLLEDNTIGPDTSLEELETKISEDSLKYVGQIVGLNNKIYFFKEASVEDFTSLGLRYPTEVNKRIKIFEFDEVTNVFTIVRCAWNYSGGKIDGSVSVNGTGETILTICEYDVPNNTLVSIKHINLNKCSLNDDESFYTQAPNIPITNLRLTSRYIKNIPAGVYQFFIRYKIRENFYTNWFPCSKELFAARTKVTDTLQGSLKHIDLHEDSNTSFVFEVEHLYPKYCSNYEQFQIGFIISADGGVFARSWKHFDMNISSSISIYFDYDKTDIEEINIDDLLKTTYDIFNVKNVAQYKNRLYITNYIESEFNDAGLQQYAKDIKVSFDLHKIETGASYYLNNIPLAEPVNGIYETYGENETASIYYDSSYCSIHKDTISNTIVGTNNDNVMPQTQFLYTIRKVYFLDNSNNSHIIKTYTSPEGGGGIHPTNNTEDSVIEAIIDDVKQQIVGFDTNNVFNINIDDTTLPISSFIIEYYVPGTVREENHTDDSGNSYTVRVYDIFKIELKVFVSLKYNLLTTYSKYEEYNTFLPFTKYDFYIHYVKQNGIVTNGYYIGTKEVNRYCKKYQLIDPSTVPSDVINELIPHTVLASLDDIIDLSWYTSDLNEYATFVNYDNSISWYKLEEIEETDSESYIIVPRFDNISCPSECVACFISYSEYGNNIAQGYNYESVYDNEDNVTIHKLDCLDLNCLLYNITSDIEIRNSKGETIVTDAKYYSSSTTDPVEYLGCSGFVEFKTDGDSEIDTIPWIVLSSVGKPYNKQLIKLTPFIKLNSEHIIGYQNSKDINSPGYFCEVITLLRDWCFPNGYYVSGTDVYETDTEGSSDEELKSVDTVVSYHRSTPNYVFSKFNLNYVSLTSDLNPVIRRYNVRTIEDQDEGIVETSDKQFITLVNSLLASYSLELKSFYKDYTRKTYQEYTKNKIIQFDNTLRVSSIDVDEIYRYVYKFEATDYYNVPTHRGIITNLISIANTLYVHCEHSLFKFTDNKTLNAQEEEVTLQENDIFNSGISEVFDAKYGYAGLKNKEQSLVTYNAYVFYDAVAQIIYAFGGEQQIGNISEPIKKLIQDINPTDIKFVGDENRNRFFVNFINNTGNVCLSFNFASKSFISIHDLNFTRGFHSRRHTYFTRDILDSVTQDIIKGWSIYRITDFIKTTIDNVEVNNYIVYKNCYTPSLINIFDCASDEYTRIDTAKACVDIIVNIEYEKIKVLEYINWVCSEILNYGVTQNFVAEEILNKEYPGTNIRIYTDSTNTDLIDLLTQTGIPKIAHNARNIDQYGNSYPDPNSWQYIQYNCGVWSMNYFRDIRNTTDVFDYKNPINKLVGGQDHSQIVDLTPKTNRQNLTQENSLIYGKYFVIRFVFDNKNFKLENVTIKLNDYGKTK